MENIPSDYLLDFIKRLELHPNNSSLKNKFIIDQEKNIMIQILDKIPIKEFEDLNDDEAFFYPLCSKAEIKRIFNPKTSVDYLLKEEQRI